MQPRRYPETSENASLPQRFSPWEPENQVGTRSTMAVARQVLVLQWSGRRAQKHGIMDTLLLTAAAFLAVAATLVAQFRVLVAAVHRLLAGERDDTDEAESEAIRKLEESLEARMERMECRIAALAMPPPPPPSRAHSPKAPPAAQQSRHVEAPGTPRAQDDAVDRPSSTSRGGFRGTVSTGLRPCRLHRIVRTPSAGPMADDDEPGAATGADARPIVRHASVDIADGPGAQPQIRSFSTRARDSLPPSGLNASFREERSDLDDLAGLPLSPLATPISSGAPARGLRTALPTIYEIQARQAAEQWRPLLRPGRGVHVRRAAS